MNHRDGIVFSSQEGGIFYNREYTARSWDRARSVLTVFKDGFSKGHILGAENKEAFSV